MGLSKDTIYTCKDAVEQSGVKATGDAIRLYPNPNDPMNDATERVVVGYALEYPVHGQACVSDKPGKRLLSISPGGRYLNARDRGLTYFSGRFKVFGGECCQRDYRAETGPNYRSGSNSR